MRLSLDESIPVGFRDYLPTHEVSSVREMGWAGSRNGILLALASRKFDALVTTDKNIQYQQNLPRLPVSVVILSAHSNALPALLPLVPKLDVVLASLSPRSLVVVTAN